MPHKYEKVVQVTWTHTNDGNHFLVSIRYGALTINGLRYTRSTSHEKHQLKWPTYRLPIGDRFIEYPTIRPMKGFTQHVISAIEEYLDSDKSPKFSTVEPEGDTESVTPTPVIEDSRPESAVPPVVHPPTHCVMFAPCCQQQCEMVQYVRYQEGNKGLNDAWLERPAVEGERADSYKWRCPCGHDYDNKDDRLDWREVEGE